MTTNDKPRPFVDVFADFLKATMEYAAHPETPDKTRELMLLLMERVREQLAGEFQAFEKRKAVKKAPLSSRC